MNDLIHILLIEDDLDDIELLQIALTDNKINYKMDVIMEGSKVQSFIDECVELPSIIVMDFNLPKVHGREILTQIKSSDKLNQVPIIVLTTSAAKEDAEFALEKGASHFITKPTTILHFNETVATITQTASSKMPPNP
ncbi:MAG: response regulator [Ferruginibacter sp.]